MWIAAERRSGPIGNGRGRIWRGIGLLLLSLLTGCVSKPAAPEPSTSAAAPVKGVGIGELARRLGFTLVESGPYVAKLQSGANTLLVFPTPNGSVYLNGRLILQEPGIVSSAGQLVVPVGTEGRIRQHLPKPVNSPLLTPKPPLRKTYVGGRVVIDAGHGGKDPGTRAASGLQEKQVTLSVALDVARKLEERGVQVVLTRSRDVFIELDDRARLANSPQADLFVSIHADWNVSSWKQGHSILLAQGASPKAYRAASLISRRMVNAGSQCRVIRRDDRGLVVLRKTVSPAVLVELGFMSNPADTRLLSNPASRSMLAAAVADGIIDYLQQRS